MKNQQPLTALSLVISGALLVYTLLNTSLHEGLLKGPGHFFYFGQTFGERFAEASTWAIFATRLTALLLLVMLCLHALRALPSCVAFLDGRRRKLAKEPGSTLLFLARVICGLTGFVLVPMLIIQVAIYVIYPMIAGEPLGGAQFLRQGGGLLVMFTIPIAGLHLVSSLVLLARKLRFLPDRGTLLRVVSGAMLVGLILDYLHHFALV